MKYLLFVVLFLGLMCIISLLLFDGCDHSNMTIWEFYFWYLIHYLMLSIFLFYQEKFIKI